MSRTIHKFTVPIIDQFEVSMPRGANIVKVEDQNGTAAMWAIVDTDASHDTYNFYVRGTGHPVPDDARYVGSWLSGPFVWHLWRKI